MQKSSDEISSHLLGACFIYIKSSEHLVYSRAFSKGDTIICTSILKHWVLMEGLQLLSSFLLGYGIRVDK